MKTIFISLIVLTVALSSLACVCAVDHMDNCNVDCNQHGVEIKNVEYIGASNANLNNNSFDDIDTAGFNLDYYLSFLQSSNLCGGEDDIMIFTNNTEKNNLVTFLNEYYMVSDML